MSEELKIKELKDLCNNPNYWDEMFSSNGKLSKELIRSKNVILIHIDPVLEFGKDCNEKGKVESRRDFAKKVRDKIKELDDERSKIYKEVKDNSLPYHKSKKYSEMGYARLILKDLEKECEP